MGRIYINGGYNGFDCSEITSVVIPKEINFATYNRQLLSECPNIEEFIIEGDNSAFSFEDGILYCKKVDNYRHIVYITKQVKELFIGKGIDGLD